MKYWNLKFGVNFTWDAIIQLITEIYTFIQNLEIKQNVKNVLNVMQKICEFIDR